MRGNKLVFVQDNIIKEPVVYCTGDISAEIGVDRDKAGYCVVIIFWVQLKAQCPNCYYPYSQYLD